MKVKIPEPVKQKPVSEDPSPGYLKEWQRLFNEIDPEHFTAYIKGHKDFPKQFQMSAGRLQDHYHVNVQICIDVPTYLQEEFGSEIYLCLYDSAFAYGWIYEDDVNDDLIGHGGPVTWSNMYELAVKAAIQHQKRIPIPPAESDRVKLPS